MQRVVYLSPFTNPGNPYIELQKSLWRDIGFEPRPFTLKLLCSRSGWCGIFDKRNAIALHWLESRPFLNPKPRRSVQLRGLLAFFIYVAILCIARARTIYFIHNQHAHDTSGPARRLSVWFTSLLARIVDLRVVHDPASAARYRAVYLPHPLYQQNPSCAPRERHASPLFGLLGAIRPYKGIDRLLRLWPTDAGLLIAGSASAPATAELNAIIDARGLTKVVQTDIRFLSDKEFETCLDRIDVLILPHLAESILVSGAFFEAIGRVPLIIARRSSFTEWAAAQMPGIHLFDGDQELPALIARIQTQWQPTAENPAKAPAEQLFGHATCLQFYSQALATNGS